MLENSRNALRLKQILTEILEKISTLSDCQSVAIRLYNNGDYPYYVHEGFPEFFIFKENSICARDNEGNIIRNEDDDPLLECMCGNILEGRYDPKLPHFTEKGSFWTNSTTHLLDSTNEEDRFGRTRNMCNHSGYESVALIPIRTDGKTLGLIQMNDPRENMFTIRNIENYERIADRVASVVLGVFDIQTKLDNISELIENFKNARN